MVCGMGFPAHAGCAAGASESRVRGVWTRSSGRRSGTCPSDSDPRFSDERVDRSAGIEERCFAEGLNVKCDRRFHVGERFFIGVALADDDAGKAERVRDVPVGVLFHHDLQVMGRAIALSKGCPGLAVRGKAGTNFQPRPASPQSRRDRGSHNNAIALRSWVLRPRDGIFFLTIMPPSRSHPDTHPGSRAAGRRLPSSASERLCGRRSGPCRRRVC